MKKLILIFVLTALAISISAQQNIYSDNVLNVNVYVEQLTDEVNDQFRSYYSFEFENKSNEAISFTPVFNYVTETGDSKSSSSHDNSSVINLLPGEKVKGSLSGNRSLTLFKAFLPGNNGTKASNSSYTVESVNINYQ